MKPSFAIVAVGLSLIGLMGPSSAQRYGEPDYEHRQRYDYRDRYEYRNRGPRYRERGYVFDEREYLRCNPDVREAVEYGDFESGFQHYQRIGRREGRRLSC
jgi:hypothetical protein